MVDFEVIGLGQCALDFLGALSEYPAADQKTELTELLIQGGGPVATALVTLARLGVGTALVGRIGDDDFGQRIRAGLEREGVDCRWLLVESGASSQFAFIAVDGGARRSIFWNRGSARPLAADEIPAGLLAGARILLLDGLQAEASLAAAQTARAQGVLTVLDGGTWRDGTAELLPWVDHLVVSERFGRQIAGGNPEGALEPLLTYGAQAVTVTLGARGSVTLDRDRQLFVQPAFKVAAVDTTGCGDVFHGGYLFGLLKGWPLPRTLRFAAACAALKTRALGGRTAIPTLAEIDTFLAADPPPLLVPPPAKSNK
jgi:ribokinase